MPTYALLGATGKTGSAILRCLISKPPKDLKLNVFARSRSKLIEAVPDIENNDRFEIKVVEGTVTDGQTIRDCLENVDVIMACIGTNRSTYGMSIAYDTTTAFIDALNSYQALRGSNYRPPTVLQLRSCSLNSAFKARFQRIPFALSSYCFHYAEANMVRACDLLTCVADTSDLLSYMFVDPPMLHDAQGTVATGYELILDDEQNLALSYADLGAAFCELAERREEFMGKAVGISSTGTVNLTLMASFYYLTLSANGRLWH